MGIQSKSHDVRRALLSTWAVHGPRRNGTTSKTSQMRTERTTSRSLEMAPGDERDVIDFCEWGVMRIAALGEVVGPLQGVRHIFRMVDTLLPFGDAQLNLPSQQYFLMLAGSTADPPVEWNELLGPFLLAYLGSNAAAFLVLAALALWQAAVKQACAVNFRTLCLLIVATGCMGEFLPYRARGRPLPDAATTACS